MTVTQPSGVDIQVRGPHRARPISFLGMHETVGWTLKTYGITSEGERPRAALVEAAKALAPSVLPSPAVWSGGDDPDRYGVGFVIVHDAGDFCFVLYDWWAAENEIHQRLYSAPLGNPETLSPHPTPAIACIWEMAVLDHERRAWMRHVLARPEGPDLTGYLRERLETKL